MTTRTTLASLPNALTISRLALTPVFAWLFASDMLAAAAAVFLVASITDFLDGYVARRRGIESDFGRIADPIADKALTGSALIGLSVADRLPWWVTVVIITREVLVTVVRFAVIRRGIIAASRGGKVKTVSQIVAIELLLLPIDAPEVSWAAVAVALVMTLVTGIDYVARALRLRDVPE